MIWLIITAIALATIAWIALPIFRTTNEAEGRADKELAVYKDQLSELKNDLENGQISEEQAKADETEISRRLLAAADQSDVQKASVLSMGARNAAVGVVALVIAVGTFTVYNRLGSPDLPGQPRSPIGQTVAQNNVAHEATDISGAVDRLSERLAKNPADFEGWILLAKSYEYSQDFANTAKAYGRAFELRGQDTEVAGNYAEALTKAAGGMVTPAAKQLFEQLHKDQPDDPRSHYYIGIAEAQAGFGQKAIDIWLDLLKKSPADAPWVSAVTQQINQTATQHSIDIGKIKTLAAAPIQATPPGPGPTSQQVAAAAQMTPDQQSAMIRSMVDGLAQRLESNPDDVEGWIRLARAQAVLKEPVNARRSLEQALAHAPSAKVAQDIAAVAQGLGLKLSGS